MCRNIRTLFNFDPPATDEEIRAASIQFVRKLSGFTRPSQANQEAFDQAIDDVSSIARRLIESGFSLVATQGTSAYLRKAGIMVETVNKVQEGSPHIVDAIRTGEVAIVMNTVEGAQSVADSFSIRRSALECRVPYFTTIAGAGAAAEGIARLRMGLIGVRPLQEYHQQGMKTGKS